MIRKTWLCPAGFFLAVKMGASTLKCSFLNMTFLTMKCLQQCSHWKWLEIEEQIDTSFMLRCKWLMWLCFVPPAHLFLAEKIFVHPRALTCHVHIWIKGNWKWLYVEVKMTRKIWLCPACLLFCSRWDGCFQVEKFFFQVQFTLVSKVIESGYMLRW